MLKKRLIPVLLFRQGILVQSINFKFYRPVGNPLVAIDYFNRWEADEIIFLDINPGKKPVTARKDINLKNFDKLVDYTIYISKKCFVPLTVGGGIRTIKDIKRLLHAGADKVCLNTQAVKDPAFISKASSTFGKQCIVVSIDVKRESDGNYQVYINGGHQPTSLQAVDWAIKAVKLGAGEIFIQSIDKDGSRSGYDLSLIKNIADNIQAPLIACSGVGKWQDLVDGVKQGYAQAVAAANIFHYTEHSIKHAKEYMRKSGIDVR